MKKYYIVLILFLTPIYIIATTFNRQYLLNESKLDTSIRNCNFKNFIYESNISIDFDLPSSIRVQNGQYKKNQISYEVSIKYLDLTGDGCEEAFISASCYYLTATWASGEYFIYRMENSKPKLLLHMTDEGFLKDYRQSFPNGSFNSRGCTIKELIKGYIRVESLAEGPECCPKYVVTLEYVWDGNKFVLIGRPVRKRYK